MSGPKAGSELAGIFAGAQDLRGLIRLTPLCVDQFRGRNCIARATAEKQIFEAMIREGSFSSEPPDWVEEDGDLDPPVGYVLLGEDQVIRIRVGGDDEIPFLGTRSYRKPVLF